MLNRHAQLLLLMAGDIETNPGPISNNLKKFKNLKIKIFYAGPKLTPAPFTPALITANYRIFTVKSLYEDH